MFMSVNESQEKINMPLTYRYDLVIVLVRGSAEATR